MRLHRFFVSQPIGNKTEVVLDSQDVIHQIQKVFRLKAGDSVIIFDGSGSDYVCRIETVDKIVNKLGITLAITEARRSSFMPARDIWLCAAVVKKDTFEWIVEKATELGVSHIIPVMAERSEKKALNEERLKKIAIEASEQSGRGDVPVIHSIIQLRETVAYVNDKTASKDVESIVFHTIGETFSQSDVKGGAPLVVFIGPEGGWSPDEIAWFEENKMPIRCLGSQVLRAETAVIAALSQVVFGK